MDLVQRRALLGDDTGLEELALADDAGADRIDRLDRVFDVLLQVATEHCGLNLGIGHLGGVGDDDVARLVADVALDRGLHTLLRDDERLDADEVTVGGHHIDHVVHLATVAADLPAHVVGLVVVTDEGREGVLAHTIGHAEAEDDVHLREVAREFLLGHLVDATHHVLIGFADGFADVLELPGITGGSDGVPTLGLPLVTLLTCCCTCFCTHLPCHVIT